MKGLRYRLRNFTALAVREHLRSQIEQAGRDSELTSSEVELVLFTAARHEELNELAAKSSPSGMPGRAAAVGEAAPSVTELRVALTVSDFDDALAFYRDALGLEQVADWSTENGRVVLLEAGRATLELLDEAQAATVDAVEAGRRVSGPIRLALEVADSDVTARRLVASGAERVAEPVTTPWGDRNARVQAPDGLQLTLFTSE